MNIAYKSTGVLIDEWFTTQLKKEFIGDTEEINKRESLLLHEINQRLSYDNKEAINHWVGLLKSTLRECWLAQDELMSSAKLIRDGATGPSVMKDCALSAIIAQQKNKDRNILIRKIDAILGESDFTQLEKSY